MFFTLDKSTDSELENAMLYTTVEEQWDINSALKADNLTFEKCPLNVLVHLLESSSLSTPIQHRSHHLKL